MSTDQPIGDKPLSSPDLHLHILRSLRRIMRRVELSSRELETTYGVTAPQLICLLAIVERGSLTQAQLSEQVHLSASTLVGVLDRLETKQLVRRERDARDRRRINLTATDAGTHLARQAPPPLQDTLLKGLGALSDLEQLAMAASLHRLVYLLEAQDSAVAPMLAPGPIPQPEPLAAVLPSAAATPMPEGIAK